MEEFGGEFNFLKRYCDAKQGVFGMESDGASNLEELSLMLKKRCMIRRMKEDVIKEIPKKHEAIIFDVEIDRTDYDLAESDLFEYVYKEMEKKTESQFNLFEGDSKEKLKKEFQSSEIPLQLMTALRKIAGYGKIKPSIEILKRLQKKYKKVIVFSSHIEVQKSLIKEFAGCAYIIGEMDMEQRNANNERFLYDEDCNIIICSLKAANFGIDLISSNCVVFIELDWNPMIHEQAEDRSHRIGQTKEVQPYYILAENTIDQDMYELISEKRKVVHSILNGGTAIQTESIMDELVKRYERKNGSIKQKFI